ncbi:MAG: hypothetical protein NT069_26510 [Planctomycetota bacterium]|nr:hypothetical protein [Planctomycetota bacterium]
MSVSPVATVPRSRPRQVGPAWVGALVTLIVAAGLTFLFWPTLWTGGGLVGGDIYYYFLPQKAFYADALQRGELPVWNNLVASLPIAVSLF